MKINSQTKISVIIKHNKEAIDVIASINPHFNKLRNPVLRAVLAPRVTIEEAARIGKCEVSTMLQKLSAIGFEIETTEPKKEELKSAVNNDSILQIIHSGNLRSLDVRPTLEKGQDPFSIIMETLKEVPDGHALEVINTFEPTPLIKILNKKGYLSYVELKDGVVKTYFTKLAGSQEKNMSVGKQFIVNYEALGKEKEKFKGHCRETDVRDLEMPLPMVTILAELESINNGEALFVHHKKVPQYLLPELADRGFNVWICEMEEGNVKLLIHK